MMAEKRYYQRDYEELYYIIDSQVISEKDFDERVEYDGYNAFEDSLTGEEIVGLLNENEQLKQQLQVCLKHHNCILETEKICVMCDECASLSMDYTNSIGGIL